MRIRLHRSSISCPASCDIFVTNDAGLRSRTLAAYDWLGVKTRVLTPAEFVEYPDARHASAASA